MPNPDEVATIVVQGRRFDNWESVWVQHRWTENYPEFRFSTADIAEVPGEPPPSNWQLLQIKPGDAAAVYLGPNLAVAGVIYARQTAYDKDNKGVMLQGVGVQFYAARASVIHRTGNFDKKTLLQVAQEVAAPTGVAFLPIGNLDSTPFKQLQVQIGEPIGHFIERIARPRGAVLGSDHHGNLLLIGTQNISSPSAELVEGVNILKCQALISEAEIYSRYLVHGQTGASDDQNGAAASEQDAQAMGWLKRYSPILTPAEQPVWSKAELQTRAQNEARWSRATLIQVHITVQGWMMPGQLMKGAAPFPRSHELWQAGALVSVYSPMAMLDMYMAIKTVTFTQDRNSGTLTELELVMPWALGIGTDVDVTDPSMQDPATDPTVQTGPAATPPAAPASTPPPDKLPPE